MISAITRITQILLTYRKTENNETRQTNTGTGI